MLKLLTFLCIFGAAFAKPGLLAPSLRIAAAPTFVSVPRIEIVRPAPVVTLGAPLAVSGGLVTGGLGPSGLISSGLVSSGLIANGAFTKGLISNGLVSGGIISGDLVSGKLIR